MKLGGDKEKQKDQVPNKSKRKAAIDYVVKQTLSSWGDLSSESGESEHPEDSSMIAIKDYNHLLLSLCPHGKV